MNKFRVQTHVFMNDKFESELERRILNFKLEYIDEHFTFISNLTEESNERIDGSVFNLILKYKNYVDSTLKI